MKALFVAISLVKSMKFVPGTEEAPATVAAAPVAAAAATTAVLLLLH